MTSLPRWLPAIAAALVIGVAAGLWAEHRLAVLSRLGVASGGGAGEHDETGTADGEHDDGETDIEPVPTVRVVPASIGTLTQSREVFGRVVPRPGALIASVVHCDVIVQRVMVIPDQLVAKDQPLVEVRPSPGTLGQLESAQSDAESAAQLLAAVREKQKANLATRQELLQAEADERAARMKVTQLVATMPDQFGVVRAGAAGRITTVNHQNGAIAPAGATLVEILEGDAVMVELSVLPDDAAMLKSGSKVMMDLPGRLGTNAAISGTIDWLGGSVDPTSHMVDAYVQAPPEAALRVGEIVRGRIVRTSSGHVIVPRESVLPGEDGEFLFTVDAGHAKRHLVTTGLQDGKHVELISGDVKAGDQVVILGNYELVDGMAVNVKAETAGSELQELHDAAGARQ